MRVESLLTTNGHILAAAAAAGAAAGCCCFVFYASLSDHALINLRPQLCNTIVGSVPEIFRLLFSVPKKRQLPQPAIGSSCVLFCNLGLLQHLLLQCCMCISCCDIFAQWSTHRSMSEMTLLSAPLTVAFAAATAVARIPKAWVNAI